MYHFENKTLKNLEIFERKKWTFLKKSLGSPMPLVRRFFFFFQKQLKGLMPLVQRLFSFENFTLFWERFGNLDFF